MTGPVQVSGSVGGRNTADERTTSQLDVYGPGGRWGTASHHSRRGPGHALIDALVEAGAGEGWRLVVTAYPPGEAPAADAATDPAGSLEREPHAASRVGLRRAPYVAPAIVELPTPPPADVAAQLRGDYLGASVRAAVAETVHVASEAAEATDRVLSVLAVHGLVDRRVTTLLEPG